MKNGLLDAAKLFARKERRYATVTYNGTSARFRSLTAKEMRRIRRSILDDETGERISRVAEIMLVHSLVDGEGNPVLTEDRLKELDEVDGGLVANLSQAAMDHTGWNADYDIDAVDDAKKNSETTTGDEPSCD